MGKPTMGGNSSNGVGVGIKGDRHSEMDKFVCDGNEAICFKLIRTTKDLEDDLDMEGGFHSEMCHQVFNEGETIFGFENLEVNVFLAAGSLKPYLAIEYTRKIPRALSDGVEVDDVEGKMKEVLRGGYTRNVNEFSKMIESEEKDFRPFGELRHSFSTTFRPVDGGDSPSKNNANQRAGMNGHSEPKERVFEIYVVDCTQTPKFQEFVKRMEAFLLFFIDAASFTDSEGDDKWKYFVLFEKYKTSAGDTAYAFAGYTTVYQFYAYPDKIRPRVAQMLVLPPFQRQGLAPQMMTTVYEYYRKDPRVTEITVEDPSDEFEYMKDFVDARDCQKLKAFSKDNLKKGFNTAMAEEALKVLKMPKRQARRVYEMLRLRETNVNNDAEFKEFRLDVKRRLNIPYEKQQSDIKRLMRRKFTEELSKVAALDDSTRKTELESNFQLLLTHYKNVLQRLEKHGFGS